MNMRAQHWKAADSLGMTLSVSGPAIGGSCRMKMDLAELRVEVPLRVVSSINSDDEVILLLRSYGNLVLLLWNTTLGGIQVRERMFILDVIRMPRPEGLFEKHGWRRGDAVEKNLEKAVVRRFAKHDDRWHEYGRQEAGAEVGKATNLDQRGA